MHNLIDREALKRDVRDVVFAVADTPLSNDAMSKLIFQMGELVCKKIDDAPGVDAVAVRHGQWSGFKAVGVDDDDCYVYRQFCSICNGQSPWDYNYCPNCGAKMMDGDADAPKS